MEVLCIQYYYAISCNGFMREWISVSGVRKPEPCGYQGTPEFNTEQPFQSRFVKFLQTFVVVLLAGVSQHQMHL